MVDTVQGVLNIERNTSRLMLGVANYYKQLEVDNEKIKKLQLSEEETKLQSLKLLI